MSFLHEQKREKLKLILLGDPGAGKGTVAKLLTALDGLVHISTGDILRGAVQAKTDLGKEAEAFMKRGDLVPDYLIMGIMEKRLQEPECAKGFLLDGFTRTIPQAEELTTLLAKLNIKLDMAVDIVVPRDIILDRLCTRRTCENPKCQAIYNVKSNPPRWKGSVICDKCGAKAVQREDETETAITHRLETYNQKTAPLIGFYREKGLLLSVPATSSDDVIIAVKAKLNL
jgi:adenylate kinase